MKSRCISRKTIRGILIKIPGTGFFSHVVELDGGMTEYRYSFSTAHGHRHYVAEYEKGQSSLLPDWVKRLHPAHILWLCAAAIEKGEAIPEISPVAWRVYRETLSQPMSASVTVE